MASVRLKCVIPILYDRGNKSGDKVFLSIFEENQKRIITTAQQLIFDGTSSYHPITYGSTTDVGADPVGRDRALLDGGARADRSDHAGGGLGRILQFGRHHDRRTLHRRGCHHPDRSRPTDQQ